MKLIAGLRNAWKRFAPATKQDVERILMKVADLAAALTAIDTEVQKIGTEIQTLQASLANIDLPPEAQAAIDTLTAHVKTVDDLIPDMPTTTT